MDLRIGSSNERIQSQIFFVTRDSDKQQPKSSHALPEHAMLGMHWQKMLWWDPSQKSRVVLQTKKKKGRIQHHAVPGWSPTPVLSGLKPR